MPYIERTHYGRLEDSVFDTVNAIHNETSAGKDGMLNYAISRIVSEVLQPTPVGSEWKYADIARGIAAFECAKLEFYRRVAGPKEDRAIETNGDIPAYERLP
jgi:hypothetical protein